MSLTTRQCRVISELRAALSEQVDETHRMIDALYEARAERDAAIAALREIAGDYGCHMREPADPSQPPRETPACREQYPDDRSYWCDPCIASAAVSGSSEPR